MSARLDHAFKVAQEAIRASYHGLQWLPIITAYVDYERSIDIAMPWTSNREKDMMVAMARAQMKQFKATHYVAVTEAYMAEQSKEPNEHVDLYNYKGVMPSQNPNRFEVLFLHGEDQDGSVRAGYFMLVRKPKTAKRAKLGAWTEVPTNGEMETTLFTRMFDRTMN